MLNPVPILLYHSVSPDPADWITPFAVSPTLFEAHLDAVRASGRQPLTVSEYTDGLRGRATLPDRPVLITFDDGFADFAEYALPALAERELSSTMYVTTGALAGSTGGSVLPHAPMLSVADLPWLESQGVEIGGHSHTHRQLDLLPASEVAGELIRCRDLLSGWLGHRIRSFAYPHGYWRAQVRELVRDAGFDSGCTVGEALSSGRDHPLALSRLMVRASTSAATVAEWLGGTGAGAARPGQRVLAFGWRQYRRARVPQRKAWLS